MKISFTRLGHEECEQCEAMKFHKLSHSQNSPQVQSNCKTCEDWQTHRRKAEIAREYYRLDTQANLKTNTLSVSADLEKVIMLPRLEMFKRAIFSQRIIAFNESFVRLGKNPRIKPFACVWHEGVSGRKKEDLVSTFYAFFRYYRDVEHFIIWLDNCSAQNKNWTLFSFFVFIINSDQIAVTSITIRYFEPGHSFMSADSFHHQVEQSLKQRKKVYDFDDFVDVVQNANSGKVTVKTLDMCDFFYWQDHTSTYKINHMSPRPILRQIVEIVAQRGEFVLHYKTDFNSYQIKLDFLKIKSLRSGLVNGPSCHQTLRGITQERKDAICRNLLPLIPPNRHDFWINLRANNETIDLRHQYDD